MLPDEKLNKIEYKILSSRVKIGGLSLLMKKRTRLFWVRCVILGNKVVPVQVSMKLEMKDSPGQLVAALKPISEVGGNIIAVIHHRDPESTSRTLNVQIVLALPEGRLDTLVELLKEQGVHIQRIGKERLLYKRTVILIGHLMHTNLSDTVDQIDSTGFAEVCEISMGMPEINERSTSRVTLKATNRADMDAAVAILRKVASQKSLLLIEPLEESA
jgi:ACT domain-containing protein